MAAPNRTPRRVPDPSNIEVPDPEMVRILRAKTGAERIKMASDMFAAARRMLRASIAARHPDWTDEEVHGEVVRRLSHGEIEP